MKTVVTCFYVIKSKFPVDTYKRWIENFKKLECNVICFTDKYSLQFFNPDKNWFIIELEKENWDIWKYKDYFELCEKNDHETYHTKELYMIWCNKPFFLKTAIRKNPFNSIYFVWCDIGVCREEGIINKAKGFPNSIDKYINENEVLFSQIDYVNTELLKVNTNGIIKAHDVDMSDYKYNRNIINYIQGGFIGCTKYSIDLFINDYIETLDVFIKNNIFGGKDQYIFNTMVRKDYKYIKVLCPDNTSWHDIWFSFLIRLK